MEASTLSTTAFCITAIVCLAACAAGAAPVHETKYGRSALRLEVRPDPLWFEQSKTTFEQLEETFAKSGVTARWISVADPLGCPYYKSEFIPSSLNQLDKREAALKEWVKTIHAQGMAAMSWYPLIICQSGRDAHPEWAQVFFSDPPNGKHPKWSCCINSGYGQALVNFCVEAVGRFGLDGIWFDGSAWTQIWDRPIALSCRCPDCKRLFTAQTGLTLPEKIDWSDPVFRRWVAWRYDTFGAYIGKLAGAIRKAHPNAAVVVNHYHRPAIPWHGAIPLNPYGADIISGSEATGEQSVDVVARLCRAYGRAQSEVWRPFDAAPDPDTSQQTDELIHHALNCITAGSMPSFGCGPDMDAVPKTAKYVSEMLDKLRPYVCSESVPYAALHLSQQTETFYFSRDPKGLGWAMEPFWKSITGWTAGLTQGHISPDYLHDRQLDPKRLAAYGLLLMPMSLALSDEQCRTVLDFARNGGTVVLGIGAGALDEWGEKRSANPLEAALGFHYGSIPSPAANEAVSLRLARDGRPVGSFATLVSPLVLADSSWQMLYTAAVDGSGSSVPAIARRAYGKGRVLVAGIDLGGATGMNWQPVVSGDTSMAVSDETAARGKHSLKFIDGPNAPQIFYPDMEIRFQPFGPPAAVEGRLSCALRLGRGAQVHIEGRESSPKLGPSVHVGRDGKLWAQDKPLADVPFDTWFELQIQFRLAGENPTYDLTFYVPGRPPRVFRNLPYVNPDFRKCDWFVIYGEGTNASAFYLDDLRIQAVSGGDSPTVTTVLQDDFEATPVGKLTPTSPVRDLAAYLLESAPAPVEVSGPDSVKLGVFRRGRGETVVHLHNSDGRRNGPDSGPVTLATRFAVKSATLALSGWKLDVKQNGGKWLVTVPGVRMHEVVVLR